MYERNYNDPIYKDFRKKVLRRDKYKCQWPKCNCRLRKLLRVHHIRTWSEHPHLRFVVANGVCLCKHHHDKIWGQEDTYVPLFLQILRNNDIRSKEPKKTKAPTTRRRPKVKRTKRRKKKNKSFAQRYVEAKRKARKK